MAALTENVVDFARGRLGGAFNVTRRTTALQPALQQVVAELQSAWPERTIETSFLFDNPVNCDGSRIGQLFSNLLGNALTNGTTGSVIRVHASTRGDTFVLVVTNPSDKIPLATLERLFQPFVRGDAPPNRQGLGLGLFIASEIAKAHGGTLNGQWLDGYTRFSFEMPLN